MRIIEYEGRSEQRVDEGDPFHRFIVKDAPLDFKNSGAVWISEDGTEFEISPYEMTYEDWENLRKKIGTPVWREIRACLRKSGVEL